MTRNTLPQILLPLAAAAAAVAGIALGRGAAPREERRPDKLSDVLRTLERDYVDAVSYDSLVEKAIPAVVEQLDPHSVYIPAAERQASDEPLRGNFDGIGIRFNLRDDTVCVIQTIPGGPSEKVGIRGGDRIVTVNDTAVAGVGIDNDRIMGMLKGRRGTQVKVGVRRAGVEGDLSFEITRGKIPLNSIDAAYICKKDIGYIKIARFSLTTYREFMEKVQLLKRQGMRRLVLDLRSNSGGIMQDAIRIADEFLPAGRTIVYTEGQARPRADYISSAAGFLQNDKVVVLVDEFSASASEILAGALQDNDRGTIVGRRSFGKGLVQEPMYLRDGSELRLTVARYYTPTGRSIQKPYDDEEEYAQDLVRRYERGEFTEEDSIKHDESLRFTTPGGRTVYGGGGIMPDVFVPADTARGSKFFAEVRRRGLDFRFAYDYTDQHRAQLEAIESRDELLRHLDAAGLAADFARYAAQKGVKARRAEGNATDSFLLTEIKAMIARDILTDDDFYYLINQADNTFARALEIIEN